MPPRTTPLPRTQAKSHTDPHPVHPRSIPTPASTLIQIPTSPGATAVTGNPRILIGPTNPSTNLTSGHHFRTKSSNTAEKTDSVRTAVRKATSLANVPTGSLRRVNPDPRLLPRSTTSRSHLRTPYLHQKPRRKKTSLSNRGGSCPETCQIDHHDLHNSVFAYFSTG